MNVRTTRNGDRLYVGRSLAFLARRPYVNAWGWHCIEGTVFGLDSGEIQRDAVAWSNLPASEPEIVAGAMRKAGDA